MVCKSFVASLVGAAIAIPAAAQCGRWLPGGGVPGVNGTVYASTVWDPDGAGPEPELLVIGGGFTLADRTTVVNVAAWDGQSWRPLGQAPTALNSPVKALTVWNGQLWAGGSFGAVQGGTRCVARFDGDGWVISQKVFTGTQAEVVALEVYGSELVAGGRFTGVDGVVTQNIGAWNGTSWRSLGGGAGSTTQTVLALRAANGLLYAGGSFITAGGQPAKMAAKWDGNAWSEAAPSLSGDSQSGYVACITVHNGEVCIGGNFFVTGNQSAWGAARLVAGAWQPLGSGFPSSRPAALLSFNGTLLAAGQSLKLQRFNGSAWVPFTGATDPTGLTLCAYDGKVYCAGAPTSAGGFSVTGIAEFDGVAWHSMGSGTDNIIVKLETIGDQLYAGGAFTTFAGSPAKYIATGAGDSWTQVGSGLNGRVVAIGGLGGLVVAGGWSNESTTWNGSAWAELVPGSGNDPILPYGYAVYNNELICVGSFGWIAGVPFNHVARWDGTAWQRLGVVFPGVTGPNADARCAAVYNGELYVGGHFETAGGITASRIARWNGTSWQAVGTGMSLGTNDYVTALLVHNGALYAAGQFSTAGGVAATNIARWDGNSWSAVGGGMNAAVFELAEYGGQLVAAGNYTTATPGTARYVARWDGAAWQPLGLGVDGPAYALAVHGNILHVGGAFLRASGKPSAYYARWTDSCCPSDYNGDQFVDAIDYDLFIAAWVGGNSESDFNNDGFVDAIDYDQFIAAWVNGC